jgi:hypothetical protein
MTTNNSKHDVYNKVEKLLQSFSSYINSFDGSPYAFANAEPMISEVFHKDWIFITADGPKDLQWYRSFCKSFAEHGSKAKVVDFRQTEIGIQVTIKNTINGVEVDPITYDGTAIKDDENGQYKIKYFEPVVTTKDTNNKSCSFVKPLNKNMINVGKMIQLVADCDSNPSTNKK